MRRCCNCGSSRWLAEHHVIPRSMWRAGKYEPLNLLTLCQACHSGWHERRVVIYRDVLSLRQRRFLSNVSLRGQDVNAWLDDRYPRRP